MSQDNSHQCANFTRYNCFLAVSLMPSVIAWTIGHRHPPGNHLHDGVMFLGVALH